MALGHCFYILLGSRYRLVGSILTVFGESAPSQQTCRAVEAYARLVARRPALLKDLVEADSMGM